MKRFDLEISSKLFFWLSSKIFKFDHFYLDALKERWIVNENKNEDTVVRNLKLCFDFDIVVSFSRLMYAMENYTKELPRKACQNMTGYLKEKLEEQHSLSKYGNTIFFMHISDYLCVLAIGRPPDGKIAPSPGI